jgi:hypothetical protein
MKFQYTYNGVDITDLLLAGAKEFHDPRVRNEDFLNKLHIRLGDKRFARVQDAELSNLYSIMSGIEFGLNVKNEDV